MAKRFQRIPIASGSPNLFPNPPASSVPQILREARNALTIADSEPEAALSLIEILCEDNSKNELLFGVHAEILEISYRKEVDQYQKKIYLEGAISSTRKAYELSGKKNLFFSTYLGYLMNEASCDVQGIIDAMHQLFEGLVISEPIDPLDSIALYDVERDQFAYSLEERIEIARKQIINLLGFCVLKSREVDPNSSLIIQQQLKELKLDTLSKAKIFWISLTLEQKRSLCFIGVENLKSLSSHEFAVQVLSHAISHFEVCRNWNYWSCSSCDTTFPRCSMHSLHIKMMHLDPPYCYDWDSPHWIPIINYMAWIPLSLDHNGAVQPRKCKECESLLEKICKKLMELISNNFFLEAHMMILIQRCLSKFDCTLRDSLIKLGMDKTEECICLLESTQLQGIQIFLNNMFNFTARIFEKQGSVKEMVGNNASGGDVSLSNDSLYFILDEHSFSTSENSSREDANDAVEVSVPPHVDDMLAWVYSDESQDVTLDKWIHFYQERKSLGEKLLDEYKGSLQSFWDSFLQTKIQNESENNNLELSDIEKETLQYAIDVHQLEIKLNYCNAYDYKPIVMSIIKPYFQLCIQRCVEDTVETTIKTDDGATGIILLDTSNAEDAPEPKVP